MSKGDKIVELLKKSDVIFKQIHFKVITQIAFN